MFISAAARANRQGHGKVKLRKAGINPAAGKVRQQGVAAMS